MRSFCVVRVHGIKSVSRKVDTWTCKVLATVHNPLEGGDDDYYCERSHTVI